MSEDPSHPMYKGEIENLSNRWLYQRLDQLESDNEAMRILIECARRSFGDYESRMSAEDY